METINKEQFLEKYNQHQEWLKGSTKGLKLIWNFIIDFKFEFDFNLNLSSADLRSANLSSANLGSANLSRANLRSANLDYSSGITLACSTKNFKADLRLAAQLAMHFCWIDFGDCEEAKDAQKYLKDLANKMHLIQSGELEKIV